MYVCMMMMMMMMMMMKDQSVKKTVWKQTDGQTDAIDCTLPSRLTRSIIIQMYVVYWTFCAETNWRK